MDTSAGVLRRSITGNGVVTGVKTNPFHHKSRFSCPCSKSSIVSLCKQEFGIGSNLKSSGSNLQKKSRKLMVCGFYDEGYMEYYSSGRGNIRCGKKEKDVVLKKTKKKLKLLKGLTKNLSNLNEMGIGFGFDSDLGLVDQVKGKTISEATELLLGQLQQLKAEEKEMKRKRKEEKALMKMQRASPPQVQDTMKCEMSSSSSSSSSSSESSGDECENLVDMKNLNCKTLAQTIPEACERALEDPTPTMPQTQIAEVDASIETSSALSASTGSLEVSFPANLEASDCHIGNVGSSVTLSSSSNATVTATTTATGTKKIEVCMGGKCKKSGAAAILEKFQQVAGIEAAVSGCKCMGKCKVGPNVKVSGCSNISSDAFQAGDSVSVNSTPSSSTNSLCIGVGLEDVNMIAANLLGRYQEVGLANAAC